MTPPTYSGTCQSHLHTSVHQIRNASITFKKNWIKISLYKIDKHSSLLKNWYQVIKTLSAIIYCLAVCYASSLLRCLKMLPNATNGKSDLPVLRASGYTKCRDQQLPFVSTLGLTAQQLSGADSQSCVWEPLQLVACQDTLTCLEIWVVLKVPVSALNMGIFLFTGQRQPSGVTALRDLIMPAAMYFMDRQDLTGKKKRHNSATAWRE